MAREAAGTPACGRAGSRRAADAAAAAAARPPGLGEPSRPHPRRVPLAGVGGGGETPRLTRLGSRSCYTRAAGGGGGDDGGDRMDRGGSRRRLAATSAARYATAAVGVDGWAGSVAGDGAGRCAAAAAALAPVVVVAPLCVGAIVHLRARRGTGRSCPPASPRLSARHRGATSGRGSAATAGGNDGREDQRRRDGDWLCGGVVGGGDGGASGAAAMAAHGVVGPAGPTRGMGSLLPPPEPPGGFFSCRTGVAAVGGGTGGERQAGGTPDEGGAQDGEGNQCKQKKKKNLLPGMFAFFERIRWRAWGKCITGPCRWPAAVTTYDARTADAVADTMNELREAASSVQHDHGVGRPVNVAVIYVPATERQSPFPDAIRCPEIVGVCEQVKLSFAGSPLGPIMTMVNGDAKSPP